MAEIYRAVDSVSNIERLLKDQRYQEAKALLGQRVKQNPQDREATLYLLLVNVTLDGLKSYEKEVERLRNASDLSDVEKEIVRRLFLIAFTTAEKKGEEKQAWLYQRLLRRLLINQPVDQASLQASPTDNSGEPTIKKHILPQENHSVRRISSRSRWVVRWPRIFSKARKPIPLRTISVITVAALLTAAVVYCLTMQGGSSNDVTSEMEAASSNGSDPVVVVGRVAFSGGSSTKAETVDKLVADQLPNLQRIYREWAQENTNLMGSLLVRMRLDGAGNVAKVENTAARIMDGKFRGAVLEELRKWKFAKDNPGAADFTIFLLFVPQGMDARHIVRWEKSLAAANAQIKPVPDGAASIARKLLEAGSSMMPLNFVLLILAILLWAMSLFLVAEAAKGLKWVVGERPGAPQPFSGVDMSQLLSCFFVLLWLARQLLLTKPGQNPFSFLSDLLVNPESLTPGILLAVFPPLVVGMMKLITAMGAAREETENQVQQRNQLWVNMVFLSLHVAVGAAAAVVLVRVFA